MYRLSLLVIILSIPFSIAAQDLAVVKGRVIDAKTGKKLPAANISIGYGVKGTSTDTTGYYKLTNLKPGSYQIISSYLGYKKSVKEITLRPGEKLTLNINLWPFVYELEEIVTTGEVQRSQRYIGQAKVETVFLEKIPSIFENDLFRSLQLLPGITSSSELSSGLYIRGGSPDQTLILFNQATIYNPSHFFGFYSTFNPKVVGDVELFKGTYPAKFGGRLGSILSISNKSNNVNRFKGNLSLSMLATSTTLEGPIDGKNGSWLFSLRRSTLDPVLNVLKQSYDDIPQSFYFLDINSKVNLNINPQDRLSFSLYSGKDKLNFPFADQTGIKLNYGNQLVSTTWKHTFSDELKSSVNISGSRYFNFPSFKVATTPYARSNEIRNFSLKASSEYHPNSRNKILSGVLFEKKNLKLIDEYDNKSNFASNHQSLYSAFYIQDEWIITDRFTFSPGIRINHYSSGNYFRIEPRVSLEYRPIKEVQLQAAYGRYNQYLTLISHEAFSGLDVWLSADEGVPPASSNQYSLGIKTDPWEGYRFDTELYYRSMENLFEPDPFIPDQSGIPYKDIFRFGKGYAYGVEFLFERNIGRLNGFANYTYSVTRRKFPNINEPLDQPGKAEFYPTRFDRPHSINLALQYQINSWWSTAVVFNYMSGKVYTRPMARTFTFKSPISGRGSHQIVTGKINNSRMPAYHRIDISFTRRGSFFGLGNAEWQFKIINLYSHRNTWFYNFDLNKQPSKQRTEVRLLPILPNISYSLNF